MKIRNKTDEKKRVKLLEAMKEKVMMLQIGRRVKRMKKKLIKMTAKIK